MSDILEPIKAYDIETLHHRTRIAPPNLKALLEHDFSKFTKVQFLGFVSILEREFTVDLSAYKEEFFTASGSVYEATPEAKDFVSEKELKVHSKLPKTVLTVLVLLGIVFLAYKVLTPPQEHTPIVLNDTAIIEAKEKLIKVEQEELLVKEIEANVSLEANQSVALIEEVVVPKIMILPKRRVWMGLIDMQTGEKIQDVIDIAYEVNSSKSWLMVFGHGYIDIEFDKELFEYSSRKKLWFIYEDGQLQKIDKQEFRKSNGGKAW
ncbi:MAG: hypothetical protein U9N52_08570 [Campylobacterota bacterium]|nr:hypothetical protein [Campylobacterota bacterium]